MTAKAKPAIGLIIFIGMISFVVAITMGGLIYMCKTNCKFQCCCKCKKNLEKTDVNLIYGDYYYTDGRSMATEMEVVSQIIQDMLRALEIKSEVKNCEFDSPDFYN